VTTHGNYIGGAWVPARSGKTFENKNPADTSEVLGLFADSGPEDVQLAVSAAREASPAWKALPAPKRGEILYRAAEILVRRKEEFSRDMTREMGKVLDETRGDTISVLNSAFQPAAAVPSTPAPSFWQQPSFWSVARQVLGAGLVLVLAWFVLRPMMTILTRAQPIAAAPAAVEYQQMYPAMSGGRPMGLPVSYDDRMAAARSVAGQDPRQVAQVVRNWVAEDNG